MLTPAINTFRVNVGYCDGLVADIAAEDFCEQPVPGMNHPAWIIGHLAFAADRHTGMLGAEPQLGDWRELFGKGSALDDASKYPSKAEVMAAWHGAAERYIAAAEAATPEQLAAPHEYVQPDKLPTLGDFITFSMTAHTATHLGQLSAWRRAMGRPSLF